MHTKYAVILTAVRSFTRLPFLDISVIFNLCGATGAAPQIYASDLYSDLCDAKYTDQDSQMNEMSSIHDIISRINERYVGFFKARNVVVLTVIASLVVIGTELAIF